MTDDQRLSQQKNRRSWFDPKRPRIWGRPNQVDAKILERLSHIEAKMEEHAREARLINRVFSLIDPEAWRLEQTEQVLPDVIVFDRSRGCRELDFEQPYFAYWTARLNDHLRYHRKLWEFVFICHSLYERGALKEGRRGVGFGVGGESLPALFASMGCEILATDLAIGEAQAAGWTATAQHAHSREMLRRPKILADDVFDQRVSFQECDMNAVPDNITSFDFCWSACALEHLGSIELGLAFIERSLECLKPGGLAIHTTEFNLTSNDDTVDNEGTVLFRRRDFEALCERLTRAGHEMVELDFHPGRGRLDAYVDMPPYLDAPHLKMALEGYATTSFGVIVRKAG